MTGALLFLQYHSFKNRTLLRLKRLKQPKYMVGAVVGALYFYFYFFRYLFGITGRGRGVPMVSHTGNPALMENVAAAIFLVVILLAWVFPHRRAALVFTEAEVAFLFPAPISRRGLIHFKLLRSQAAILFTTLVLMLVTNRFGGKFFIHAAGWWLILSTLNLHLLGCSFARTSLMDRGITTWRRRWIILGLVSVVVVIVGFWARRALPPVDFSTMNDAQAVQQYLQGVLNSGPLPWLLYPFKLVVRPYLARTGLSFLTVAGPALAMLLLHYWWVARSDVAFEEASLEASRRTAEKLTAIRSGNVAAARHQNKARRAPFALNSVGPPFAAFFWKNLISAGQVFTPRLWLIVASGGLTACFAVAQTARDSSLVAALGMASGMLVIWSLFIGPQLLRQDLRQDLPLADILKMYPVRGWEVALGELLAPASILTGVQWLLLLVGSALLWNSPSSHLSRAATLAIAAGAALVLPLINLILLQIPNAAVLLFPAWFQPGKDRTAGIEVTGQRIIAVLAQLLVFIISLIPASIGFAALFFPVRMITGWPVATLFAAIVAALVLAAESALGIMLLGYLFERFDLSAEPPV